MREYTEERGGGCDVLIAHCAAAVTMRRLIAANVVSASEIEYTCSDAKTRYAIFRADQLLHSG